MKKMIQAAFVGLALMALASSAHALTGSVSGTAITVQYQEPTTTEPDINGSTQPLDDLSYTSIYYQVRNATYSVVAATVPASALIGGGTITKAITLAAQAKNVLWYTLWATATDLYSNESAKSNTITVRVDRLAPAAPN